MRTRLTKEGNIIVEMTEIKAIIISEAIEKAIKELKLSGAGKYTLEQLKTLLDDITL